MIICFVIMFINLEIDEVLFWLLWFISFIFILRINIVLVLYVLKIEKVKLKLKKYCLSFMVLDIMY